MKTKKEITLRAALAAFFISSRYHDQAVSASWAERGVGAATAEGFRLSTMAANLGHRLRAEGEAL